MSDEPKPKRRQLQPWCSEDLADRVRAAARRRGVSVSRFTVTALERHLTHCAEVEDMAGWLLAQPTWRGSSPGEVEHALDQQLDDGRSLGEAFAALFDAGPNKGEA